MTRTEEEQRDGLALERAARIWERSGHGIRLVCGSCGDLIVTGTVATTPDPYIAWDDPESERARWGHALQTTHPRLRQFGATMFTCPGCARQTYATTADQLRAALTALGTPSVESELHQSARKVTLVLGTDLPRPDDEAVAFLEQLHR